jgi:DNA-binding GntR family transcriptional regulator
MKNKAAEPAEGLRGDRATEGYFLLRDLIVRGKLAPGSRLIETELARRLKLSRTPVRAALQRLRQEGYVREAEGYSRSRLIVAPLTSDDGTELYYLLGELEGLAAFYAARLPAEQRGPLVAELRTLNADLAKAGGRHSADGNLYYDVDMRFHGAYLDAVDRPRLRNLVDAIRPQAERYIRVYTAAFFNDIPRSVDEHVALIEAVEDGDPDEAQNAARKNIRNAAERMSQIIESMGEWGSW